MEGRSVVNSFSHKANFWKQNPQFMALEPFKSLYSGDRTKGKDYSSAVMWALAFYYDRESILRNLPDRYKLERIQGEFSGVDLSAQELVQYKQAFEELCLSEAERTLRDWEDKMRQRMEFLSGMQYDERNAEKLDKVLGATPKLFMELQRLKEQVLKEASVEGKAMGGVRESASDMGVI